MGGGTFRYDIQGLRAIAVLLVLAFHLWPTVLTGGYVGVDAFFVISGFLITGHLLENPPRDLRGVLAFWGRRIRRLLPAAFLVLVVTAIACRVFMPDTRWADNATQTIASALYVQNWALAGNSVDYLAAAEPPTPFQHYWSLSVEEQFYVVWPLLILAAFWLAARFVRGPRSGRGWRPRTDGQDRGLATARVVMLVVWLLSLGYSISATATDPASAYFITPTRVWELASGGLIATLPALGTSRLPARLIDALAWLGLAMLVLAAVAFDADTPFPGSAVLLPVGGTALVILAAATGPTSPTRILRARPVQHIGDTSYSIYLWHWPLIALWPYAVGEITPVAAAVIVAATLGLATLTKTFVEDPFRFAPSFQPLRPTFRFALVGMLVLSLLGGAQLLEAQGRLAAATAASADLTGLSANLTTPNGPLTLPVSSPAPGSSVSPGATSRAPSASAELTSCIGAAAIVRGFAACPPNPAGRMTPDPIVAATDRSDAYADGCWTYEPFTADKVCQYGHGRVRIALVGNSHAGQWLPALQALAAEHGWTITTFLASQCNATDASLQFYSASKTAGCLGYGRWVLSQTSGHAFDLVVTSERQSVTTLGDSWSSTPPTARAGYASYLKRWVASGTHLLVIRDTPYPGQTLSSVPDCLAAHPANQFACNGTPDSWHWMDPLYDVATSLADPAVATLDPTRFLCTDSVCPAVIGSVVAYFDASHMTATYARTIAPFIDTTVTAALTGTAPPSPVP